MEAAMSSRDLVVECIHEVMVTGRLCLCNRILTAWLYRTGSADEPKESANRLSVYCLNDVWRERITPNIIRNEQKIGLGAGAGEKYHLGEGTGVCVHRPDGSGCVRDRDICVTDIGKRQGLARGAGEVSRAWWGDYKALADLSIIAGSECPRGGHRPRNRNFIFGVGTLPAVIYANVGSGAVGSGDVGNTRIVAQPGLLKAYLHVAIFQESGGDFSNEVRVCSPDNPCGEHRNTYRESKSRNEPVF